MGYPFTLYDFFEGHIFSLDFKDRHIHPVTHKPESYTLKKNKGRRIGNGGAKWNHIVLVFFKKTIDVSWDKNPTPTSLLDTCTVPIASNKQSGCCHAKSVETLQIHKVLKWEIYKNLGKFYVLIVLLLIHLLV